MSQRLCYTILETVTSEDGQFIPCIVKENEMGYFKTDWLWGKDLKLAQQCADEKNEGLGHTPEDVAIIVASSFPKNFDTCPTVIVSVLGGVAYVDQKDAGVKVIIQDMDNKTEDEEYTEEIYHADDEV